MERRFKIYIIYSDFSLEDILAKFLPYIHKKSELGSLRKDFTRDIKTGEYRSNNRRFVLMSEELFERLSDAGMSNEENEDFCICEFQIRNDNKSPKDSVMHYYFPYSVDNKEKIIAKLKFFEDLEIINSSDYFIHDTIVEFSNRVSDYTKVIIKIIIDDKDCRVSWCRKRVFNRIKHVF